VNNPTKNADLIDRLRNHADALVQDGCSVDATYLREAAAIIESQDRDIAIRPHELSLLYEIRAAIGWNDKTSLSILPDGIRRARRVLATWDTPTGMDLETLATAVKKRISDLEWFADDAKRLSGCLIAIHDAPDDATVNALKSVAYDAALNCITPDVAEYQIEKRSEDEIAARNEQAERAADAREA
jgi:hypothetical protein